MKIVFVLVFFTQFSVSAQCDSTKVVEYPDVEASFPGGALEMMHFIQENIVYPEFSEHDEISRIYIEFIVCPDGSITDIKFRRNTLGEIEKMSVDLILKMPNWIPARNEGESVASRCLLPITICFN